MARKRKRESAAKHREENPGGQKIPVRENVTTSCKPSIVRQALLAQYYPQVLSLREYLLSRLPVTSKVRRKKISCVGRRIDDRGAEKQLAGFLDSTLIGVTKCNTVPLDQRWQQWTKFSQKADDSISFADLSGTGVYSQSEIIDFAIWLLFSRPLAADGRNQHLLCQGYRKDVSSRYVHQGEHAASNIPGVVSVYPNSHVTSLKAWPWPQILALMGRAGEKTMVDMVLDAGLFLAVNGGQGTYNQLSGYPLSELKTIQIDKSKGLQVSSMDRQRQNEPRLPSSINFVRNRMMYARAALNRDGRVRFGLRHIHVLNRYPCEPGLQSDDCTQAKQSPLHRNTIQVMMYMFPRQFGLHNPFTADVDPRQTVQPFKDYTLREEEITKVFPPNMVPKVPKRLRGRTATLVEKLQILHGQCPYKQLLEYYCPKTARSTIPMQESSMELSDVVQTQIPPPTRAISGRTSNTAALPPQKIAMMNYSTSALNVSAFTRAVFSRLIPQGFWGTGECGKRNEGVFHRNVDHFIGLRRFETLSLHEVSQGIKTSCIEWLQIPGSENARVSQSDGKKQLEIFLEFLYYLFDSLLIPLLRANFHITESNVHRYKVFYFRHDVWRSLAEPALASIRLTMFEGITLENAQRILNHRSLGFSQVRLLPKEAGIRPIMNLKRRSLKKGSNTLLGQSINNVLGPVYNVLSYEKILHPDRLGSTLFSVGDLYTKLKAFKSTLTSAQPLLFAKLDVQAAFDTIPQAAVLRLVSSQFSETEYRISKHAEMKPGENHHSDPKSKPIRKWTALARSPEDFQTFDENLESEIAVGRKNTVFIETVVNQFRDKEEISNLLREHVQQNMVKIGKKFYRQKEGIPQGSVVSSLLCNLFYADLEDQHLSFLQPSESLLLRLIDDFLLITTNPSHAKQFLQIMHDGLPSYGVRVNPEKTLVNFECTINEKKVPRLLGSATTGSGFPYCGSFIDMKNLDISRDRERRRDMAIVDTLTVEFSRVPGKTFLRKILSAFKIQSHAMFLDTSFNSVKTVLANVYSAFVETATKMCAYISCLPPVKQPGPRLIIKTFQDLTCLAFVLMKSKGKNKRNEGFKCSLNALQVEGLAVTAFLEVLRKKQSRYREVLSWLRQRLGELKNEGKVKERARK